MPKLQLTGQKLANKNLITEGLVTIVAISFNQEKFVKSTLDSIVQQTYKNLQLIISDDGSTDSTKKIIRDWIKDNNQINSIFLDHYKNQGITRNLNSAIPYIKGEFYQFIGCEDIMLPNKIERQVKLLRENPDYDIVYSDMFRIDELGNQYELTHYQENTYNVPKSGNIYSDLIERCFIATPTVLMRSKVLFTLGGDNEKLEINDYDFWLRASRYFQFLFDEKPTMVYRLVSTSVSNKRGCFVFLNGFLLFYYNYDRRKEFSNKYKKRLYHGIKNLAGFRCKKTCILGVKAFLKTRDPGFLKYSLKGILFFFKE